MRRDDSAAKEEKIEIDFTAQKANFFLQRYTSPVSCQQILVHSGRNYVWFSSQLHYLIFVEFISNVTSGIIPY